MIVTDHKPLIYYFSNQDHDNRFTKCRSKLEEYEYKVIYKVRKQNTNTDALSCIFIKHVSTDSENVLNYKTFCENRHTRTIISTNVTDMDTYIQSADPGKSWVYITDENMTFLSVPKQQIVTPLTINSPRKIVFGNVTLIVLIPFRLHCFISSLLLKQ